MPRHSLRSLEGYLQIDHRAAPSGTLLAPAGSNFETSTITCSHCHSVQIFNPFRTRPREYCRSCDKYICDPCAGRLPIEGCVPFAKRLDEMERQIRAAEAGALGSVLVDPAGVPLVASTTDTMHADKA